VREKSALGCCDPFVVHIYDGWMARLYLRLRESVPWNTTQTADFLSFVAPHTRRLLPHITFTSTTIGIFRIQCPRVKCPLNVLPVHVPPKRDPVEKASTTNQNQT
jgi:hypothetical protein